MSSRPSSVGINNNSSLNLLLLVLSSDLDNLFGFIPDNSSVHSSSSQSRSLRREEPPGSAGSSSLRELDLTLESLVKTLGLDGERILLSESLEEDLGGDSRMESGSLVVGEAEEGLTERVLSVGDGDGGRTVKSSSDIADGSEDLGGGLELGTEGEELTCEKEETRASQSESTRTLLRGEGAYQCWSERGKGEGKVDQLEAGAKGRFEDEAELTKRTS